MEDENVQPSTSGVSCESSTNIASTSAIPFNPMPSTSKQAMEEFQSSHQNMNESSVRQEIVKNEPGMEQFASFNALGGEIKPDSQYGESSQNYQNIQPGLSTQHIQNSQTFVSNNPNGLTLQYPERNTPNGRNNQNCHQTHQINPVQQAPSNIKIESPISVPSTVPQLQLCDNINASSSSQPLLNTAAPVLKKTPRKFIKCVSKDGKVSLMELVQDEKNPKLFKMVLPQGIQANQLKMQPMQGSNRPGFAPIVLSTPNMVRSIAPTPNIVRGLAPTPNIVRGLAPTPNIVSGLAPAPNMVRGPAPLIRLPAKNMPVLSAISPKVTVPMGAIRVPIPNIIGNSTQINSLPLNSVQSPSISTPGRAINVVRSPANTLKSPSSLPNPKLNVATSSVIPNPSLNLSKASLTLPNSAVQLPKLVAINSPLPPQGPLNTITQFVPSNVTPNANMHPVTKIIRKNNKILVLDPTRAIKGQQQSLLKPQVSLLKSRAPSNNLKKFTVSNISGLEHNINVFIPADMKVASKSQNVSSSQQIKEELEKQFLKLSFENMKAAVRWLLKKIPLISSLAAETEYRAVFPFVMPSLSDFQSLSVAKQRSFEVISIFFGFKRKISVFLNFHFNVNFTDLFSVVTSKIHRSISDKTRSLKQFFQMEYKRDCLICTLVRIHAAISFEFTKYFDQRRE